MTSKSLSVRSPAAYSIITIVALIAIFSFVVYYMTAFRTVTWWNSGEYSLAAATLGVAHPPGCLIGTLFGWVVIKLAVCGSAVYSLNLFAGLVAALTAVFVGLMAGYYLRKGAHTLSLSAGRRKLTAWSIGAVIGGLTLAYTQTFWLYATKFTPYIFTVLFTVLILWSMIKWAEGEGDKGSFSARWIFVVTLLFGLDFSVHRTNLLMAPGLLIWILIINPRTFLSWRNWIYGAVGLVLGLAVHMLIIPMAAAKPFLNASNPDTLTGFWDYVTLKQLGGGFLVNFLPRKAPIWDIQVMDYLRAFSVNFFSWKEPIPIIGLLPGIFGLAGLIGIWRKNTSLAFGMIILFLLTSAGAILYFNIPANFFRSLFRHYMPSFVIFSIWIAYGVGSFLLFLFNLRRKYRPATYILTLILILALPGQQLLKNYHRLDGANNYFGADYALNMLNTLPEDAILITFGDNDTFPLWHFQIVENIRPDVTVLNTSLLNTTWFVRQSLMREPDLPLGIELSEIDGLRPTTWPDTSAFAIPVAGTPHDFGLTEDVVLPDTMYLQLPPAAEGQILMVSDQLILNMIRNNRWKRPIYFSAAGGMSWLRPYLNSEGLVNRLTPVYNPPVNEQILTDNILDRYSYRGFADEGVYIDPTTRPMALNYYMCFMLAAQSALERGDQQQLDLIKSKMIELIPPDRIRPMSDWGERLLQHIEAMEVEVIGEQEQAEEVSGLTDFPAHESVS